MTESWVTQSSPGFWDVAAENSEVARGMVILALMQALSEEGGNCRGGALLAHRVATTEGQSPE